MNIGSIVSCSAAVSLNEVVEKDGFGAVLRHLAAIARAQMELTTGEEVTRILYTLANRLQVGDSPGRLTKVR